MDLIEAAQMRHYHKKLLEPAFELGHPRLRNYYALGGLYHKVECKARAKPYDNILHSLARYDKLAVGTKELISRELTRKGLKGLIYGVGSTIECCEGHALGKGLEECHIVHRYGDYLILISHEERLQILSSG